LLQCGSMASHNVSEFGLSARRAVCAVCVCACAFVCVCERESECARRMSCIQYYNTVCTVLTMRAICCVLRAVYEFACVCPCEYVCVCVCVGPCVFACVCEKCVCASWWRSCRSFQRILRPECNSTKYKQTLEATNTCAPYFAPVQLFLRHGHLGAR
jgi:hypothetical protein